MKEDYVSFETAKLLKKKGFPQEYDVYHAMVYNEEDYECEYEIQRMVVDTKPVKAGTLSSYPLGMPEPKCYCPTIQMALKWLRETHHLYIQLVLNQDVKDEKSVIENYYHFNVSRLDRFMNEGGDCKWYKSYEEACEGAIKYCLENLI